jgi:eukaryotic-like serine/threonine-protein kinase
MKEILDKVLNKLKAIGKEIYFFISSQIFLKNFGGAVLLLSLLLFFTFWWMRCYTKHGESLQVHDYTSLRLEDAIDKANSRSFEIVVNDSIYRHGMEPNVVLTQSPKPFTRVKENRKIYLTVTKFVPDPVKLPDPRGNDSYGNYSRRLERLDLIPNIKSRRFDSKTEPGTILEIIYEGEKVYDVKRINKLTDGFNVPKGSTIEFIVSERGGGTVPIPNLVCMKFSEAEFIVKSNDLSIGSIIPDATVTDEANAYVWKQTPKFSRATMLKLGSQIDIYITQNIPENCISDTDSDLSSPPSNRRSDEENEDF